MDPTQSGFDPQQQASPDAQFAPGAAAGASPEQIAALRQALMQRASQPGAPSLTLLTPTMGNDPLREQFK